MSIFVFASLLFNLFMPSAPVVEQHNCPDPQYLDGVSGGAQQRLYVVATDGCNPTSRGVRIYTGDKK